MCSHRSERVSSVAAELTKTQQTKRYQYTPLQNKIHMRERDCFYYIIEQTCTLGDTLWSSMQAQGLSHHLMRRALSQEEGERGEYVYVYAYLHV